MDTSSCYVSEQQDVQDGMAHGGLWNQKVLSDLAISDVLHTTHHKSSLKTLWLILLSYNKHKNN